ncbi:MAG TPA: cyclic nucleotide-binding domain-containing protein [Nitrospira sp.]|nr:cyclic nucleotide-binding domain-containing protein [Nitrospira sp.]
MTQNKFNLIGIKKLLLPVKHVDLIRGGGPTRALFGFLPSIAAKKSGQDLADFLKQVPLFEDVGVGDLRRLARLLHERSYRDGEYILEQGKPSAAMFVIRTGAVEILRRSQNSEEVHLATLESPASLGESVLMAAEAVNWFSARAHGPVSIVALGRSDLEALSHNFPLLANKVLAKLAQITALRLQMLVVELTSEQKDSE